MPTTKQAISPKELEQINSTFEGLMQSLAPKLKGDDEANIRRAYEMALDGHKYQRRRSGEAYIFHPLAVARICHEEIDLGPTAIICAILHDIVEDTPVTLQEVHDIFGAKITQIVDGLTKLDGLYETDNKNAENLKKVLSTLVDDVRVILIKMADRLHNLRTIGSMPQHKKLKIATETAYIYAPLAHRLGLYRIKTEFEDICMRIIEPDVYQDLLTKVRDTEEQRQQYIDGFINPLRAELDELGIPYRILGRSKAISSIWNKIKKKNVEFEEIYDLFAVRIIVDVPVRREKSICWQIYSIITDYYTPIPERLKDWVTTPKGNGYESLHTSVIGPSGRFVEVQIRSERMDDIAERGFAAHWKYKGVKSEDNVYERWLDNIRTLLDDHDDDAVDFLNDFKTNLFKEEVYVFTPNGDMRILPKGATALDFAFEIHSDVGAKATSIKVNERLVPMSYILRNGDQVRVNTTKSQSPKKDWLKMVITGKARSKIRSALKEKQRQNAEIGKEMLIRRLKNHKLEIEPNIEKLASYHSYKNHRELYLAIYDEKIKLSDTSKWFDIENGLYVEKTKVKESEPSSTATTTRSRKTKKSAIIINGEPENAYEYTMAQCCNPVPGDEIFAFISTASGMKIHRFNCSNATNLFTNYGYRVLKAEWSGASQEQFVVEIRITGLDTGPGVIQNITNEISNHMGLNIKSFSMSGDEGIFEGIIKLKVKDKDQLDEVMTRIKKMDNINAIERSIV